MPAIGLDLGTMFLVKSELDELMNNDDVIFSVERNAFLKVSSNEDTEDMLKENNWSYAKHENDYYILGEDAIKLKNLLTVKFKPDDSNIVITQVGELRRPMQKGILNTSEEKLSVAIIQKLIQNLIGKPSKAGECLCFCSPADPVDSNLKVFFHKTMLENFLKSLGYDVECIPEALAIIFSEKPSVEDPNEEGGISHYSGIGVSFGAGMTNFCFAFKKMPLISFSIARGGDWIDRETAKVAGVDVSSITRYKETKFDLNNVNVSDMRDAALNIFYENLIEHVLSNFAAKFNQLDNKIDTPLEIVVAGGTSTVPGFLEKFEKILSAQNLPFKVKGVRSAEQPLYAVANGCLKKALSSEKKKNSEKIDKEVKPKTSKNKDE